MGIIPRHRSHLGSILNTELLGISLDLLWNHNLWRWGSGIYIFTSSQLTHAQYSLSITGIRCRDSFRIWSSDCLRERSRPANLLPALLWSLLFASLKKATHLRGIGELQPLPQPELSLPTSEGTGSQATQSQGSQLPKCLSGEKLGQRFSLAFALGLYRNKDYFYPWKQVCAPSVSFQISKLHNVFHSATISISPLLTMLIQPHLPFHTSFIWSERAWTLAPYSILYASFYF